MPPLATTRVTGGSPLLGVLLAAVVAALVSGCDDGPRELPGRARVASPSGSPPDADSPKWVVDPHEPGPDLPPAGRSLFDVVVTRRTAAGAVYRVPFPFTALTRAIAQRLDRSPTSLPLKQVLIPLGRSLQRNAARPDFFAHPRAVAAVDGEPAPRPGHGGLLLRDRLFLGYHETAGVIEVISYNEAAGRFEFQVVKDYRAGATPRVFYANRGLCVVCHQNHAPIFARQVWDETAANPRVAALLRARGRAFYGVPAAHGVDVPYAIDNATDRANELALTQRLWTDGCGGPGAADLTAIQCRASAVTLALQYRLSGARRVDHRSALHRERFAPALAARARARWPRGLSIPDPDIPNRDPLGQPPHGSTDARAASLTAGSPEHPTGEDLVRRSDVAARFDPAAPRAPADVWVASAADPGAVDRLVVGLAAFLTGSDIARLDRHLAGPARRAGARASRYRTSCQLTSRRRAGAIDRVLLRCRERGDPRGRFAMDGVLYLDAGRVTSGTIDRVAIEGQDELRDLEVLGGPLEPADQGWTARLRLRQRDSPLHARRLDGEAVESLTVRGRQALPEGQEPGLTGDATLVIVDDFGPVREAVRRLATLTAAARSDVLAALPFRRAILMKALHDELGMEPVRWCCLDATGMPPAAIETPPEADPQADEVVRLFDWYCGRCHRSREAFPPSFLTGPAGQVRATLARCAERIFFRLGMWELSPVDRPKTPMPPAHAFRDLASLLHRSPHRAGLRALAQHAAAMLESRTGKPPRLPDLLARNYEELDACPAPGALSAGAQGRLAVAGARPGARTSRGEVGP